MKAYFFLVLGGIWLVIAIALYRTGFAFGIYWDQGHRMINPAKVVALFHLMLPLVFFGWLAPLGMGLWLLWARK